MASRGANDDDDDNADRSKSRLLHARFMPGKGGKTALVFVEDDFNVYYVADVAEAIADSRNAKIYPLSRVEATIPEVVIHGVPDWIYEGD